MRQRFKGVLAVGLVSCGALLALAGPSSAQTATFSDLSWLTGVWRGNNGMDAIEDVYQPPENGEIVSTFTAVKNGKITRYELRSIREENGKVIIQQVAFGAGLQPAPPVATRTLLSSDGTHANFERLKLARTGENTMTATVTLVASDGTTRDVAMDFTRVLRFSAP